jgi:hypothetical protein
MAKLLAVKFAVIVYAKFGLEYPSTKNLGQFG